MQGCLSSAASRRGQQAPGHGSGQNAVYTSEPVTCVSTRAGEGQRKTEPVVLILVMRFRRNAGTLST